MHQAKRAHEISEEKRGNYRDRNPVRVVGSLQVLSHEMDYNIKGGSSEPMVENYAALLVDRRLSHSANGGQKARMVNQLQQHHGNTYVQRIIAQAQSKEIPSEEISLSFRTCPWTCEDCDRWEKEELEKDKNELMRRATRSKYKGCRDSASNWEKEKVYEVLRKRPEFWRIFRMMIITTAVNRAEIKDPKVKAEYDESRRRELWEFYHRSAVQWAWYQAWTKAAE